jgi:hypothetical protein
MAAIRSGARARPEHRRPPRAGPRRGGDRERRTAARAPALEERSPSAQRLRKLRMGSGGDARGIEKLHPAMRSRMWQPGQSGNPSGHSGEYGATIRLAQRAAPKAMRRLIELMDSEDERVAAFPRSEQRTGNKPKQLLDRKSPIQVRIPLSADMILLWHPPTYRRSAHYRSHRLWTIRMYCPYKCSNDF